MVDEEKIEEALKSLSRFLRHRMRSKEEIRRYLVKKGYSGDVVEEIIQVLEHSGILNDELFVEMYMHDALVLKFKGPRLIESELLKLGVDRDIIRRKMNEVLEKIDLNAIVKEQLRFKKIGSKEELRKYLFRRGFDLHLLNLDDLQGGE